MTLPGAAETVSLSRRIDSAKRKGKWWYSQLVERYDLERKHRGKGIAINVHTGEYAIADTDQEAAGAARAKFGAIPIFATFLLPYSYYASVEVIEGEVLEKCQCFWDTRRNWLKREADRLYEAVSRGLAAQPAGTFVIVDVERGRYVLGKTHREAKEKARAEFTPVAGCGVYRLGESTENNLLFFRVFGREDG